MEKLTADYVYSRSVKEAKSIVASVITEKISELEKSEYVNAALASQYKLTLIALEIWHPEALKTINDRIKTSKQDNRPSELSFG